jgi:3,4-dihydroxy 2-butanone 4-phosphate synthase/GTP cyclohydrolase II
MKKNKISCSPRPPETGFCTVEEALRDFQAGRLLVVTDAEDRENEGDLICAAEKITPEKVNFMAQHGRGLICVALTADRVAELGLPMMVNENTSPLNTAFTVSVEAKHGVTTGISARDRSQTIKVLVNPRTRPSDLTMPGHIFPLRARNGGVLVRAGQTESAVDLARMAGLSPAGVLCEIMNKDGSMARVRHLKNFAKKHHLNMVSIASLIECRRRQECIIKRQGQVLMPSKFGDFQLHYFTDTVEGLAHLALVRGKIQPDAPTLVRVHSECLTGDALGSIRCDCGEQRDLALRMIGRQGGVFLYLRQEGRGIGLLNKLKAYELQETGLDTVEANVRLGFPADKRDYGIGAQILKELGVRQLRLLTNNPQKIYGLEGYDLEITERIPISVKAHTENKRYLSTKKVKFGHLL